MSTFRTPVGPQPSRVYWRRRLLVGLGLLAVIVVVILIVVRPGSGGTPTTPKPGATNSSPSATTGATAACDPKKITLDAVTDAGAYDAGVTPQLTFAIKSLALQPCTIQAGTDVQEYKITSGDETIWDSKDCQTGEVPSVVTLQPGVPVSPKSITWDRTRSAKDTCDATREPVVAGGASYHLVVTIGDLVSSDKQFILN